MNIPNILTTVRFCIVPFFGYYLYKQEYYISITLFLIAGATDVIDGYIARKYNMITAWGKFADPLADKLMQITAILFLALHRIVPLIALVIILSKELLMGIGSLLIYKKERLVIAANWYGKMATVIFHVAVILIIVTTMKGVDQIYIDILAIIAVASTLFALSMYIINYFKIRQKST